MIKDFIEMVREIARSNHRLFNATLLLLIMPLFILMTMLVNYAIWIACIGHKPIRIA